MKLCEQEFYDYKTAPVNGSDVVDLTHTGMSFYDQFIQNNKADLDYLRNNKNLKGDIVMMSPEEYFQACSDYGFSNSHPSVDKLKHDRSLDKNTLQHLKDVLTVYKKKFPMPMLNKADNGQEGLHRMMVIGDMFGWDHKVPVLVVDWADKQRAYEEQKQQRINKIKENIRAAVKKALYYKFGNIDELKEQLQWELDKQFEFSSDIETPVDFELTSDEQTKSFIVTVGPASYDFDYEDVQFIEPEEDTMVDDDFDVDDLDLEDTEDFLKRYFGDDWRRTHPHLKDTFNIKESYQDNIPSKLYHATYKQFLKSIKNRGLGNTRRKMWNDSVHGTVYLADDPEVATSYAETSEWVEEQDNYEEYIDNIVVLEIDSNKLDKSKLKVDSNVLLDNDEKNSTWEYHGVIPWEDIQVLVNNTDTNNVHDLTESKI